MGTVWRVRLVAPPGWDLAALDAAIAARLAGLVVEMSHWDPRSHLSRYARAPAGSWHILAPDFAHVMAHGLAIAAASGGAFDPALGPLTDHHGLGPTAASTDRAALESARARSGRQRLTFDPAARRLLQPGGAALDLSGIAKGHAADALADLLATWGVRHCLVEVGGELVGRGARPDGEPWWVDLETPPGADLVPLRVALHDLAVATSGDYVKGRHTLDPATGEPAAAPLAAVSVLHQTALAADAWATALMVMRVEDGLTAADREGLAARLVERTPTGYREHLSRPLKAML